ncbi:hypothetical protein [Nocardia jiangxiensis]|uniref:Ornithine cyclodeaminase n=1 Tax=Nocardia jiangxiensis TaxID=282685 RepID=A0ABW6S4E5_9NOCA|nr:hypothetical protein [Nocardia jiangxiensis]
MIPVLTHSDIVALLDRSAVRRAIESAHGHPLPRPCGTDITLFQSVGLGLQDLVTAQLVLDR